MEKKFKTKLKLDKVVLNKLSDQMAKKIMGGNVEAETLPDIDGTTKPYTVGPITTRGVVCDILTHN